MKITFDNFIWKLLRFFMIIIPEVHFFIFINQELIFMATFIHSENFKTVKLVITNYLSIKTVYQKLALTKDPIIIIMNYCKEGFEFNIVKM